MAPGFGETEIKQADQIMKIQIDLKSAAIGLIIGTTAMFILGDATRPNEIGRYQVSSAREFVTIIDTQTGEAWGLQTSTAGENGKEGNGKFWDPKPANN